MAHADYADPGSQGVDVLTLAKVLAGLRQGCDAAATAFSMPILAELRRYAAGRLSRTTRRHPMEADDLVQAVVLELCKAPTGPPLEFADVHCLTAFLHRIVDGDIRAHRRATRTLKRYHVEESLELRRHDQVSGEPDQRAVAEVEDELLSALMGLPLAYGRLIVERRGGATILEAANDLGISERTAQRWLHAVEQSLAGRRRPLQRTVVFVC